MGWFIPACVLFLIGALALTVKPQRPDDKRAARLIGALCWVVAAVFLFLSMTVFVGSREVAIVQSFGKYTSTEGPGIHLTAPWSSSDKFTTRTQNLDVKRVEITLKNDAADAAPADVDSAALKVPGGGGDVTGTCRWKIGDERKAVKLWRDYKDFDTVKDTLVTKECKTSIQAVFGTYVAGEATAGQNRRRQGQEVAADLDRELDRYGIDVISVTITDVNLGKKTSERVNDLAATAARLAIEQNNTRIAKQEALTRAARQGTRSVHDAQIDRCLEVANSHPGVFGPGACLNPVGAQPTVPVR